MEYLAKFAKLIRGNLNASVDSKISLSQEISMLDNYLALEKLRFIGGFEYKISCDSKMDQQTIKMPSMLVQPFVENAVLHGMKDLDYLGLIKVDFTQLSENEILITVSDNGKGRDLSILKKSHKSLGMSITQKRLAHINGQSSQSYSIEPIYSASGTKVDITVVI